MRLPIEHKEAIEKAAVDAKTTASAYAARVLLEAATGKAQAQTKPSKADKVEAVVAPTVAKGIVVSDPKALEELRRIGININQIAHALNAGRPTKDRDIVNAVKNLFTLLKDPEAFMRTAAKIPADVLQPYPSKSAASAPAAAPLATSPAAPKVPAAMPRQPWPEPARPEPTPKPVTTSAPEPRQIPPHVFAEIAKSVAAKTEPITAPTRASPSAPQPTAAAVPPRPTPPSAMPEDLNQYDPAGYRHWTEPKTTVPAQVTTAPAPTPSSRTRPRLLSDRFRKLNAASQTVTKDPRRDPPHPQARHQLQDRASVHPPRPGPAKDRKPGRLGFLSKLWGG
ncbi:MAG: plasmid mobilization relaxosome protein MobC [Hyphomicrobium zavarzinii]|uniref:MobC family plasmid mobilization relaxosome protein n=1 Tax=Hyphomicrobium zavarzinii TaxID=48292 RepID=UPI001A6046EF|nr:plasmid mobilization relaxosome protein MobC [Hyphomicrobium zavarzinii]MBL8845591.1 plasmid mobilization relaxosome protein MobC [Hyphomicrobium zavarzinii]